MIWFQTRIIVYISLIYKNDLNNLDIVHYDIALLLEIVGGLDWTCK